MAVLLAQNHEVTAVDVIPEKYFEWCEITDEKRKKVDELRKELGV